MVKVKVKFTFEQTIKAHRGEKKYSSTLYLTSAIDGGGRVANATPRTHYPREETWYPLHRMLDGTQGWSGQVRRISPHRDSITRVGR
jgi:hypothetical protein